MQLHRNFTMVTLAGLLTFAACDDANDPVQPPAALPAPQNVVAARQGTDVIVTWGAVPSAESYVVERDRIGDNTGFVVRSNGVAGTTYTDPNVPEDAVFQYRVLAARGAERSPPSVEAEVGAIGPRVATLSGTITGLRTLHADTVYTITGITTVDEGATLSIPAGTLLLGNADVAPSALIVRQGGKLMADGSSSAPIVFTSSRPAGQRQRGDWGGVVLNGRSWCNFPASACVGEGTSGSYGGTQPDDNSGVLRYVRIEFAGYEVSFGNELNALTLNGVGSGTVIEFIQVHYGSDDGIEWFGGTVDVKYAIATGISDDSFDFSTGWQGRGQFWIAQQDPNDADAGWEVDNNEDDYNATPRVNPRVYNVTLVGKGPNGTGGTAGESTNGILYRRGAAGDIANVIVTGFGTAGLDIDNDETYAQCATDALQLRGIILWSNANVFNTDADDETACGFDVRQSDPQLARPFDRANPDFRPAAGSSATQDAVAAPANAFFTAVDYIGAIEPGGTEWYKGWTTFAAN